MTRRRSLMGLALAALLTGLAGCGGGSTGPEILFITNSNSDWWNAVEKGMRDGAEEFGVAAEMRRNEGSTQGQVEKLREALSLSGVKAVAVSVIEADAPGVIDAMRELQKAGKIVIVIDSDVVESKADVRRAYIGTDNAKAGEAAGRAAAALKPAGGKVVTFVGTASAANARARKAGFFTGAGEAFEDLETFQDQGDLNRAATNVQDAITKYNGADVMLGLWSYNAPAIAQEVNKSADVRSRATVVTFDLDEAAVGHIEGGRIDVSVCQNPYEMGYQGVKLLKAMLADDAATIAEVLPDGKNRDTGVRVIVPKLDSPAMSLKEEGFDVIAIDEMKSWLASKGLRSS